MGRMADAIGWLTVATAVAIVSLQIAYLLSADSIANPLPNKPSIDMTSAVVLPTGPKGSVFAAPKSERAAGCDSFGSPTIEPSPRRDPAAGEADQGKKCPDEALARSGP